MFRRPLLLLPATALLLVMAQSAIACTCGRRPTLLEAFERADEVVVLRVVSVEKVENTPEQHYVNRVKSTTMVVEKVFKGNLKVGEQIVFAQGGGGDCILTFHENLVGYQSLMYLQRPERQSNDSFYASIDPSFWLAYTCERSDAFDGADSLYLQNIRKVKGKTRIAGSLSAASDSGIELEGKTIKIIGPKKVYKTKTNKNGVFEVYDLPPGKYFVEPEIPQGWKIDPSMLMYTLGVDFEDYERRRREWSKRVEVTLEPKKQAEVDFSLVPDNFVRGRVLGPKGTPLPNVCVELWQPVEHGPYARIRCTDEQGRFEITSVPKGDYVLVVNPSGKPSTREPFTSIFYPNVAEFERAAVINVAPGETLEDLDIVIPQLEETITIEGVLRYSDGKPVVGRYIEFKVPKTDDKVDANVSEKTDSEGRFKLTVLKGVKGELFAELFLSANFFKNCPKVDELLARSSSSSLTVFSNKIELTTEQDLYQIELTLPFPQCEER